MTPADPNAAPEGTGTVVGLDWLAPSDTEAVESAWSALRDVFDPELGLDVVSLGLVYDVKAEHGRLSVEMTLTTPGCPVSESLPEQARTAIVDATGGALGVDVDVVWDPPWTPAMMSEDARASLGFGGR